MLKYRIIDIRLFASESLKQKTIENMSSYRYEKYKKLKNEKIKLQCLASSYLVDELLKEFNYREKDVKYTIKEFGKPEFANIRGIYFSISHSENVAMCVMKDSEVGCDIERVREIDETIYDLVFSDIELDYIRNVKDVEKRTNLFYKFWVIKEASIKYSGEGIKGIKSNVVNINDIANVKEYVISDLNEKYYYYIK